MVPKELFQSKEYIIIPTNNEEEWDAVVAYLKHNGYKDCAELQYNSLLQRYSLKQTDDARLCVCVSPTHISLMWDWEENKNYTYVKYTFEQLLTKVNEVKTKPKHPQLNGHDVIIESYTYINYQGKQFNTLFIKELLRNPNLDEVVLSGVRLTRTDLLCLNSVWNEVYKKPHEPYY